MPDITMCVGKFCPLKETCYRYLASPNEYQSYFLEAPYKNNDCEHYWKINKLNSLKNNKKIKSIR